MQRLTRFLGVDTRYCTANMLGDVDESKENFARRFHPAVPARDRAEELVPFQYEGAGMVNRVHAAQNKVRQAVVPIPAASAQHFAQKVYSFLLGGLEVF
ncbi:hypothetical protein FBQ82_01340 [Anaerolineae bacterium CFX7]|nr:hypothetical protein [Anaerolineae bacterium CFX7]